MVIYGDFGMWKSSQVDSRKEIGASAMRYLLIVTVSHYHFPALLALNLSHVLYLQVSFIIDREKQRFQAIFLSQQSSEALEAI